MSRNTKKKNKRFPLWGKVLVGVGAVLAFGVGIGVVTLYGTLGKLDTVDIKKEDLGIVAKEELQQYDNHSKIKNIALYGIDSENGVGRSDAIMIATIDPVHDKLKITSIMRDSYVNIAGHGYDKINHAYAFGQAPLAIKTLNQTFGLNIEDFVAVDFASLPKIIDMLGGIDLTITKEEINCEININSYITCLNRDNGTNSSHITSPGTYHVDGTQALAYSRIRYTSGGDYERTQRQRTVLNALFNKALSISPTEYLGFINKVLPYVKTSLNASDILSLAGKVATMGGGTLEQERFPKDDYAQSKKIDGIYYLTFDEAATKKQIMDYIFDDIK